MSNDRLILGYIETLSNNPDIATRVAVVGLIRPHLESSDVRRYACPALRVLDEHYSQAHVQHVSRAVHSLMTSCQRD